MLPKEFVVCEIVRDGQAELELGAVERGQWIKLEIDPNSDGLLIRKLSDVTHWRYYGTDDDLESVDDEF